MWDNKYMYALKKKEDFALRQTSFYLIGIVMET